MSLGSWLPPLGSRFPNPQTPQAARGEGDLDSWPLSPLPLVIRDSRGSRRGPGNSRPCSARAGEGAGPLCPKQTSTRFVPGGPAGPAGFAPRLRDRWARGLLSADSPREPEAVAGSSSAQRPRRRLDRGPPECSDCVSESSLARWIQRDHSGK